MTFLPAQQRAEKLLKSALTRSTSAQPAVPAQLQLPGPELRLLPDPAVEAHPQPRQVRLHPSNYNRPKETTGTREAASFWLMAFCTLLSQTAAAPRRKFPSPLRQNAGAGRAPAKTHLGDVFHPRASRREDRRQCRSLGHPEGAAPAGVP